MALTITPAKPTGQVRLSDLDNGAAPQKPSGVIE